jgi:tetratricopeptide (TPR) repeat protein
MEKFIVETMRIPRYDTVTNERLESPYVFQRFPGSNFKLPAVLQWLPWSDSFFFLGAEGSGVSWHRHNAAVQEGVYGWKRWLLLPPSRPPAGGGIGFWSILEWVKVVLPTLQGASRPLECIVGPGDLIYVPENWFHAILNVRGDSVSVSLQASKSVTEHKKLFDAMLTERDVPRRISLLQNIVSLTPQDSDTHFSLARLYLQSGDLHNALASFKAIIRQDPFRIDAMYKVFEHVVDKRKAKRKELLDALLPFEPLLANSTDRSLMANHILAVVYRLTKNTEKELDKLSRNADLQKSGTWFGTNLPQHNFSNMLVKAHRRIFQTTDEL